jgi:hypothetical protein
MLGRGSLRVSDQPPSESLPNAQPAYAYAARGSEDGLAILLLLLLVLVLVLVLVARRLRGSVEV